MNIVKIRKLELGTGRPAICIPVAGRNKEEIDLRIQECTEAKPDLAEWRADWFEDALDEERLWRMLDHIREELGDLPLLVTLRTKKEGGEMEADAQEYERFLYRVLASGQADMIDIELSAGEELLRHVCVSAHRTGMLVTASSHDFSGTPSGEEIVKRLCRMQECGADVLKLAAMPKTPGDVLTLLAATWEMKEKHARQPVVTMSMGKLGAVSRLSGEIFGSAMTFGTAGTASAPGQIGVRKLREAMDILHIED